jgi:hypothetical protein
VAALLEGRSRVKRKSAWSVLGTYSVTHAAVDAACAVLLWTAYGDGRAFADQPLLGLADRLRLGRGAVAGGALLTATTAAALVPGAISALSSSIHRSRPPEDTP